MKDFLHYRVALKVGITTAMATHGIAHLRTFLGGEFVFLPKAAELVPLFVGGSWTMAFSLAIATLCQVVDVCSAECKETLARFVDLARNQGGGQHGAIEMSGIVVAAMGIVEIVLLQVEVGIVLDADELECIDDGLS